MVPEKDTQEVKKLVKVALKVNIAVELLVEDMSVEPLVEGMSAEPLVEDMAVELLMEDMAVDLLVEDMAEAVEVMKEVPMVLQVLIGPRSHKCSPGLFQGARNKSPS